MKNKQTQDYLLQVLAQVMNDGSWNTSYVLRRKLPYEYHNWEWSKILSSLYERSNLLERTESNKISFKSISRGRYAYRLKLPVATQGSLFESSNIPQRITKEQLLEGLKKEFKIILFLDSVPEYKIKQIVENIFTRFKA